MINIKTQTKRATTMIYDRVNVNMFCGSFEFGIVTSKYWGEFDEREEPLVELEVDGTPYRLPMSEFIKKLKKVLSAKNKA